MSVNIRALAVVAMAALAALATGALPSGGAGKQAHALQAGHRALVVYVNDVKLPASASALLNNNVFVSLRAVAKVLGADVAYDARKKQITLTTVLRQTVARLGDPSATVNGEPARLQPPARAIHGRIMLPLRALARAFDAQLAYDAAARKIVVTTNVAPRNLVAGRPGTGTRTLEGTVTKTSLSTGASIVQIDAAGTSYTLEIPAGANIQFRDTHGAIAGEGRLSQVKPGDTLIATLDAGGRLLSLADVFAATIGTIAAVAGQSMVLTNGKVVSIAAGATSVTLDGRLAGVSDLRAGDLVTVRADPQTGKVRAVMALRRGGPSATVPSAAAPNATAGTETPAARIDGVSDDAERPLRAGQTLHVAASGTPGGQATFDLADIVVANEMRETGPGHYEGSYIAKLGTNLIAAPIVVSLRVAGQTAMGKARNPLTIITQPPQIKDTVPSADARIGATRPSIYATFATVGDTGMDTDSLRMFVNGSDVTAQAAIAPTFIAYYPPADLRAGQTAIEVKGTDVAGNSLDYRWTFTIISK